MTKQRILVVGDDMNLRATLARWLIAAGYSVELAESAKRAREVVAKERIGLAIVAPERLDGSAIVAELRTMVDRLILVTEAANGSGASMEQAIQADACLAKPLSKEDVLARIDAVLGTEADATQAILKPVRFADYILDVTSRTCFDAAGRVVALTRAEFSLLLSLALRPGRVVSRDELTRAVAGRGAERGDRSVDMLISRLRRKIEADPKSPSLILTVPGVGYMSAAKPQVAMSTAPTSNSAAETDPTEATATWSRQPPQRCRARHPNRLLAARRWRVSPVSRSSF